MLSLTSPDRPEPVMNAAKLSAAVTGAVSGVGAILVLIGGVTDDDVTRWAQVAGGAVAAVATLLTVVLPLVTAYGARAQVTPLAAPVGVDGVPLLTTVKAVAPAPAPTVMTPQPQNSQAAPEPAGASEYEQWIAELSTDTPVDRAPDAPADRTPQPIEQEAQAAAAAFTAAQPAAQAPQPDPATGPITLTTVPPVPGTTTQSVPATQTA